MARLQINNLVKKYGDATVVNGVSLNIPDGEFLVLLGPSGCGKTTTLRMVAGFITPTEGTIQIGERDITNLPPWKRNCGLVFQNYALFPHMTVAQNVAFGLEMRKVDPATRAKRVDEALRMVRLGGFGERYPRQMSGGQQQRVALARALAIQPDVLLLDEPLSNLDAKLRQEVRVEIRELQRELGLTTIMVTHDQEEALTMADRLVVMNEGLVRQIGTKRELYDHPADPFVAGFIGRSSFIAGRVASRGTFVTDHGLTIQIAENFGEGPASLALRPERVALGDAAKGLDNVVEGRVEFVSYLGAVLDIHVRLGDHDRVQDRIIVSRPTHGAPEPVEGDVMTIGWAKSAGLVYSGK
jgi:putative spermidine/putrescine transport system ATP-binding protein